METAGQALSHLAAATLATGLYHGIGFAIDLGIRLQAPEVSAAHAQSPPPDNGRPVPGDSRR